MQDTPEAMVLHPGSSGPLDRIQLFAAQPSSGSLEQWFQEAVRERSSSIQGFRPSPMKQSVTRQGTPYVFMTGQGMVQGQKVILTYTGMKTRDGQGLLMSAQFDTMGALRNMMAYGQFTKSLEPGTAPAPAPAVASGSPAVAPPSATAPAVRNDAGGTSGRYSRPAGTTAAPPAGASVTLPAATGEPPAKPNGHDLYDWFGNFHTTLMPGPNFTLSQEMIWTFYRFFSNGYVYEGMPEGVDPGAINCPTVVKGGRCKQYTLSGTALTIEGEKPHTLAQDGGGIKIDGTSYNRVRRADRPMNGRWETSAGGGLLTTVTLSQHMLTLRPDGSFLITGSTGVSGSNVAAYGSSAYSGHYKLNGYTIEFDYANGRVVQQSILLPYPDDNAFLIGSALYFVPKK
jgi:hypothetical protein